MPYDNETKSSFALPKPTTSVLRPKKSGKDFLTTLPSKNIALFAISYLTLNLDTATIAALETLQLTATARSSDGDPVSGYDITWTSDDETKAIVDSTGLVTGVDSGSATITATHGLLTATCIVTVS